MSVFDDLIHKTNRHQLATAVVLAIYIISGIDTPYELAKYINTTIGHIILIIITLALFVNTNIILGIIMLIACYEIIRRSSESAHNDPSKKYINRPITENFSKYDSTINSENVVIKDTRTKNIKNTQPSVADILEIDVISKMIPLTHNKEISTTPWKPIQSCNNDVTPV